MTDDPERRAIMDSLAQIPLEGLRRLRARFDRGDPVYLKGGIMGRRGAAGYG